MTADQLKIIEWILNWKRSHLSVPWILIQKLFHCSFTSDVAMILDANGSEHALMNNMEATSAATPRQSRETQTLPSCTKAQTLPESTPRFNWNLFRAPETRKYDDVLSVIFILARIAALVVTSGRRHRQLRRPHGSSSHDQDRRFCIICLLRVGWLLCSVKPVLLATLKQF
jgi:hypothetical protein